MRFRFAAGTIGPHLVNPNRAEPMKFQLTALLALATASMATAAPAQDRSPASAQAFIRESFAENARAMLQPVGRGGGPWGVITSVSSANDCATSIRYAHGTIVIDWSKVQTLGAQSPTDPRLWVQGQRDFIVLIGGLRPGWERVRFATLTPTLNGRVADAMKYLQEECDRSRRHGF